MLCAKILTAGASVAATSICLLPYHGHCVWVAKECVAAICCMKPRSPHQIWHDASCAKLVSYGYIRNITKMLLICPRKLVCSPVGAGHVVARNSFRTSSIAEVYCTLSPELSRWPPFLFSPLQVGRLLRRHREAREDQERGSPRRHARRGQGQVSGGIVDSLCLLSCQSAVKAQLVLPR